VINLGQGDLMAHFYKACSRCEPDIPCPDNSNFSHLDSVINRQLQNDLCSARTIYEVRIAIFATSHEANCDDLKRFSSEKTLRCRGIGSFPTRHQITI